MAGVAAINPMEMLYTYQIRPGELDLFVAYGDKDEFNIAAQVDSFLWHARQRGLVVGTAFYPDGKHDLATGLRLLPQIHRWSAAHTAHPH